MNDFFKEKDTDYNPRSEKALRVPKPKTTKFGIKSLSYLE